MKKASVGSLLLSCAILLGLAFTSCGGGGGTQTPPVQAAKFSASPATLGFGDVLVSPATTKTLSVTISNSGNASLVISALPSFTGADAGDFKLVNPPSAPITVAPSSSVTLQVSFTPSATRTESASLSFTDNAAGSPHTVALGGSGILPPAQAADAAVSFTPNTFSAATFPTTVTVTIKGTDTTFFNGATMANFGPGATVSSGATSGTSEPSATNAGTAGQFGLVNVVNATTATAQVTFDATAGPGPRSAIVTTAGHQSMATFMVPSHGVPVANAGMPQIVGVGKTAHLDGSASSTSNAPLTYLWTLMSVPSGSTTSIANPTSVRPSFVVDKPGDYLIELTVTDGATTSANWTMVSTTLTPPVANAGADQFVTAGASVQLDGSASSDFGGNSLTYAWAFAAVPAGSNAALSNPNAVAPTFVADLAGDYPVQLTVNDGNGNTSSDTTLVSTKQTFPIANAGPNQVVNMGSQAQLNGSGSSDPDGDPVTCAWALIMQPPASSSAQLSNAGPTTCATKPTFTVGQTGIYVAELTVSDGQGNNATANVVVVTPPDDPGPVAVAGPHQIVAKGTTVQLDGSQSTDAANNPLTYSWSMLSKPTGSTAALIASSDPSKPKFVADLGGDYVCQLIVSDVSASDGTLTSVPSTVRVTATVPGFSTSAVSINFPPQHLNTTSSSVPVVITNTGNGTLHISSITKTGANAGDFAFTSATLPIPVAPGATTTINVTFTPTAAGARSATLNITNDATANPATITLTGTGGIPAVQFTPNPLAFSAQNVNTSAPLTLKISNTGDGPLVVTAAVVSGTNAGEFQVAPTTIPTIAPNSFQNVTVTFTPTAAGTRSATLTLTDNTSAATDAVNFSGIGVAPGAPVFNPNPINFSSNQLVGSTSATLPVTITNPGTGPLVITAVTIGGANAADFPLVAPPTPITVPANGTTTVNLTFKPGAAGARAAQLSLTDNAPAPGSSHSALISGTGATSTIGPPSVTFPGTVVGTVSAAQTVTITNPSTASGDLTVSSISVSGTNSQEFVQSPVATPFVLHTGQSLQVSITFNPAVAGGAGTRSATLNISDSSHTAATAVALSGTAQAPGFSLSTTTLTFTGQTVGKPGTLPLTITNPGTANLVISVLSVTGPNAADFSVAPPAPLTVLPGGNVTLNVTFTPAVSGTRTATLNITDNATGSPQPVALIGNGVTPVIGLAPNPLAFGNQTVNIASAAKQVTISNTGNATLTISAITPSGANASDFTFSPAPPISVAAGGNTTLNVIFKPATASAESATFTLTDNTVAGSDPISLTGTGVLPTLAFSPTGTLSFGNQLIKTAGSPVTLTITNNGLGTLQISSLTFAGTNAADFSFAAGFTPPTQANPITVLPNANVVLSLIFTPQNEALESASLNIADNATGTPQSVALSGTGVAPHIALSPSPVAFGQQALGTPSSPATITITNSGGADLSITFLSVTGANAADFVLSPAPTFPITVPKNNGTATLTMVFTPATGSSETATLNFIDNATTGPNSLALTGTGTGPQMGTLLPLTFTGQSVGTTSSPQIVTVTNTGTGPMKITGLSFTGPNASDFATSTVASVGSPITVAANGGTAGISVTFSPSGTGARTASLVITDNAPGNPHSVTVSGTGNPVPIFGAAPNPMVFPSTTQGVTSAPIALTISNTGQVNLVISGLTKAGANPGDYTSSIAGGGNFPQTIVPGGTLVLNVFFTPAATGASSATLLFADNTTQGSHAVNVSGTGTAPVPQCTVTPNPLTFPATGVQSTSAPMAVTCTNSGTADLTITAASITGANASEFAIGTGFPITVPKNGGTGNISLTFTPAAGGARTATLSITDNAPNSPQTVTLNGTGTVKGNFSLNAASLGGNLETLAIGSLDVASSTALTITVKSSDPTKVLVDSNSTDPSGTAAGTGSFTATMAAGQRLTPGFWIQALASSGTATVTISAPGYNPAVATVTLTPSGFQLNGPAGTGANFTATLGTSPALSVSLVQLDASGNVLTPSTSEVLRGGATVSVTINSGTTATGTISGPAVIQPGTTTSSSVTFSTKAAGTSLLTVTQPSGFIAPKTGAQLTATVVAPTITINPVSIGFNQQVLGSGRLNQAPTSTLSITLTSSDSTKVQLSTSPTTAGTGSITVQVAAGGTALPSFYIQSLVSSGSVTLTPTATGYTAAPAPSGNVSMTNSAFVITGPQGSTTFPGNFATTTISSASGLTLAIWQLDSTLKPLSAGQVRPGISESVTVNNGTPGTGAIVGTNPAVFNGGDSTNTTLSFQPGSSCSTSCTTTLSVTQPAGFATPSVGGQLTVTVNLPSITLSVPGGTVGANLEASGGGYLDAPAPSNLAITITSNNPNVLLSSCGQILGCTAPATDVGSQSITVVVPQNTGTQSLGGFPGYYVQALATSGTAILTASAPGFISGSFTVTLAASGFVINDGLGGQIAASVGSNVNLNITSVVLDGSLAPTQIVQVVRGGLSPAVNITSDSPAGVVLNSPVGITGGNSSGTVTVQAVSQGTANITAAAPAGFTTPSVGNKLGIVIQ